MRRVGTIARSLIVTVAAVLGGLTIIVVALCLVTGVRPAIVISGSMEPSIPTGSMTFARSVPATSVEVGDVVTVERTVGKGLVTHRVVAIDREEGATELTLRGDANTTDDPLPYRVSSVGQVIAHVPGLGTVAGLVRTPFGITAIVVIVVAFLVFGIRWNRRSDEVESAGPDSEHVRARHRTR
jgi:signal peptidase